MANQYATVFAEDPNVLSSDLIEQIKSADKILLSVQYWDVFENSLFLLRYHTDILRVLLVNRSSLELYSQIKWFLPAFHCVVFYDGPAFMDSNVGNMVFGDDAQNKYHNMSACTAVKAVMDKGILPNAKANVKIYIGTTNEELVHDIALLRQEYKIEGGMPPEIVTQFIHKRKHAEVLKNQNIAVTSPCSKTIMIDTSADMDEESLRIMKIIGKENMPIFVKPECGSGSFGTGIIRKFEDLKPWLAPLMKYKIASEVLLQEFIQGVMHTFTLCCVNGELMIATATWTIGQWSEFLNNGVAAGYIYHDESSPRYKTLANKVIELCKAFKCDQYPGSYFLEIIETSKGTLKLLDFACRSMIAGGINITGEIFKCIDAESIQLLGPLVDLTHVNARPEFMIPHRAHVLWPDKEGYVEGYNELPEIPGIKVERKELNHEIGTYCKGCYNINNISCEVTITGNSHEQLINAAHEMLKVDIMRVRQKN